MKKGFTLIELLAVILILGIIVLIAIPMVSDAIEEAKKNAAINTAYGYVKAIENNNALSDINPNLYTYIGNQNVSYINDLVSLKGKKPTAGSVNVVDGFVSTASLCIGKYQVSYSDSKASISGKCGEITTYPVFANGTAIYFNPETGLTCDSASAVSTTGTKTGCMKWYAFNDVGDKGVYINLILDHNTTAVVQWNSTSSNVNGPLEVILQLKADTSSWIGVPIRSDSYTLNNGTANYTVSYNTSRARLITADEISEITGNSTFNEETTPSTSWFYFDSNNQTQTAKTIGASNYDWLFDYTKGCTSNGCNIADISSDGYWTVTAARNYNNLAWFAIYAGALYNQAGINNSTSYGVRPVITVSKIDIMVAD